MEKACSPCPLRLYNTKHHNLQGFGNPWAGNVIIIPNVDYDAYKSGDISFGSQVDIIKSIFPTGGFQENCYIVPLIRCNETISCDINDDIINLCMTYLIEDIKKYNWKKFLVCGTAWNRIFNRNIKQDINNVIYSTKYDRLYTPNYSPLTKFIDDIKYKFFVMRLMIWYNHSLNNTIPDNYEMLYL